MMGFIIGALHAFSLGEKHTEYAAASRRALESIYSDAFNEAPESLEVQIKSFTDELLQMAEDAF